MSRQGYRKGTINGVVAEFAEATLSTRPASETMCEIELGDFIKSALMGHVCGWVTTRGLVSTRKYPVFVISTPYSALGHDAITCEDAVLVHKSQRWWLRFVLERNGVTLAQMTEFLGREPEDVQDLDPWFKVRETAAFRAALGDTATERRRVVLASRRRGTHAWHQVEIWASVIGAVAIHRIPPPDWAGLEGWQLSHLPTGCKLKLVWGRGLAVELAKLLAPIFTGAGQLGGFPPREEMRAARSAYSGWVRSVSVGA